MTIKVAINGYGRIGRNVLRAHYEGGKKHDLAIVAINDLGSPETNAHLTRYDTVHGPFPGQIEVDGDAMVVNGDRIKVLAVRRRSWSVQLGRGSTFAPFLARFCINSRTALSSLALLLAKPENGVLVRDGNT